MENAKLIEGFKAGWKHFCSCINWAQSAMDAEAIRFMNEMPGKIIHALEPPECESSESS